MFSSLPTKFLYTAYRLTVTYEDIGTKDKTVFGTGFFVNTGDELYLVTNRHNIDAAYYDKKYAHLVLKSVIVDGYFDDGNRYEVRLTGLKEFKPLWPENPDEDLAIIHVNGQYECRPEPPPTTKIF